MKKSKATAQKPHKKTCGVRCNSCKHVDKANLWCTLRNCRTVLHAIGCEKHEKAKPVHRGTTLGMHYNKKGIPGFHGKPKQDRSVRCLKCDKEFFRPVGSIDRLCPQCHTSNERMGSSMANPENYGML